MKQEGSMMAQYNGLRLCGFTATADGYLPSANFRREIQ
jgi:hypothetical protein